MRKIGIIGGSGFDDLVNIKYNGEEDITTKYGKPSMPLKIYESESCRYYHLSRHGKGHTLAPHKINYRANVMAFKECGVEEVVSFSSVGGINVNHAVGAMLLLDNAIDFTNGRESTFFDESDVIHVDLTNPFCSELREIVKAAAISAGIELFDGGVYICTNGPRLETAAEIKMYRTMGADVVGMTTFPEASLFRECEICYTGVALVTNHAAGVIHGHKLTADEVIATSVAMLGSVKEIIKNLDNHVRRSRSCMCGSALQGAKIN